jgi:hypothetical protein
MAHYAFLDENNIVTEVIEGVNESVIQIDLDGTQVGGSSEAWETFYGNFRGQTCKRTSYNHSIRKQYAGIGYSYDPVADVFITPQPFASWSLDENFDWQAPISMPETGVWIWEEESLSWTAVPKPFNSWVIDSSNNSWQAPTPRPIVEGKLYYWSEDSLTWAEHTQP